MKELPLGGGGLGVGTAADLPTASPHALQTQTLHCFPLYFMRTHPIMNSPLLFSQAQQH